LILVRLACYLRFMNAGEIMGRAIGFTAFHLSRRKRRLSERSLSHVLGLSGAEMHKALKGSFYCFWQDLFSLPPPGAIQGEHINADFPGRHHLEEALARQKGVILWESSSLGRRYLAKRLLYERGFPVCQVHSESHIGGFFGSKSRLAAHIIRPLFERHESAFVKELLTVSSSDSVRCSRDFLERLRRNEILCISADGRIGNRFVPITFLGRNDRFPTGVASLARTSGATILPVFCVEKTPRVPSLIIESPIRLDGGADRESSVNRAILQYITLADSYIRKYPEQYRAWNSPVTPDD
jgi:lauroyl/myristoyl acyltransferase